MNEPNNKWNAVLMDENRSSGKVCTLAYSAMPAVDDDENTTAAYCTSGSYDSDGYYDVSSGIGGGGGQSGTSQGGSSGQGGETNQGGQGNGGAGQSSLEESDAGSVDAGQAGATSVTAQG
jgi:hypothetical protein